MSAIRLFIGDKRRSSWSLRPWLFLTHHAVPFSETVIELDRPETRSRILQHSPSGRVPLLVHGDIKIWESLAICEYAAETFALPRAWPLAPAARALARAMATEMHAGFADLRKELPFDPTRRPEKREVSDKAAADIVRISQLWREARNTWGKGQGDWLFGSFGIVDAMFAPVALRFHSYGVQLKGAEMEYAFSVLANPAVQEWMSDAEGELESSRLKPMESTIERTAEIAMPMELTPIVSTTPAPANKESIPAPALPAATAPAAPAAAPTERKTGRNGTVKIKSVILPPD